MKIVVLTNELPPYRRFLFSYLSRHIENIKFYFVLNTKVEPFRTWNEVDLDNVFIVKSIKINSSFGYLYIPDFFHLFNIIRKIRPDVIITSQLGLFSFYSIVFKIILKSKIILWLEHHQYADVKINFARKILRKVILHNVDAFWFYGNLSYNYFKDYINDRPYIVGSQIYNFEEFYNKINQISSDFRDTLKSRLNLRDYDKIIAYVGRLESYKGVDLLLSYWDRIQKSFPDLKIALIIIGYGSLEKKIQSILSNIPNVYYIGKVNYSEIHTYYSIIDLLIFPTIWETWGFVVDEALCAGIPVLVSYRAGASELVNDGVNGSVIDPFDIEDIVKKIKIWLFVEDRKKISANYINVAKANLENLISQFIKLINIKM